MSYQLYYSRQALADWGVLRKQGNPSLVARVRRLLSRIEEDPFVPNPPYKKLSGELLGLYARRLSPTHCLVYQVIEGKKIVMVVSMWTHYGD